MDSTSSCDKTWRGIVACRTAALGGQQLACDKCGHNHWQYHSCMQRSPVGFWAKAGNAGYLFDRWLV